LIQATQAQGSGLIGRLQPLKAKYGRLRRNVAGRSVHHVGTSVITPDPSLSIGEIGIPLEMAETLSVPVVVTDRNIKLLQTRVDTAVSTCSF
jgi:DNA-directed RNA polymerase beta' subunit